MFKWIQKQNQEAKVYDLISVNDLNYCNEWMTNYNGPFTEFVYDDGLRWTDIWKVTSILEHEGSSTRSRRVAPEDDDAFLTAQFLNENDEDD